MIEELIINELERIDNYGDKEEVMTRCLEKRIRITSANIDSGNESVRKALESVLTTSNNPRWLMNLISKIREKNMVNSNYILFLICRMLYGE